MIKLKTYRFHQAAVRQYEMRRLREYSATDIIALNKLLQSSMHFYMLHTNAPARPDAAQKLFRDIPFGRTENDKFVLALFDGSDAIACVDVVRGYPRKEVATIKLFLIAESYQGRGLGPDLLANITELIMSWGCQAVLLGVCGDNALGFKFWRREGFQELRRESISGCAGDAITMQRKCIQLTRKHMQPAATQPGKLDQRSSPGTSIPDQPSARDKDRPQDPRW